jgi:hypothetical protein
MVMEFAMNGTVSETNRRCWLVPVICLSLAIGATLALGGADAVTWIASRLMM